MKTKYISIKTLMRGNKRKCLSVRRPLGRCFECGNYGGKIKVFCKGKPFFVKPCESRIENIEYNKLIEKKQILYKRIKKIDEIITQL